MKNQSRAQSPESRADARGVTGTFGGASYASPHSIPGLLSGTRITRPSNCVQNRFTRHVSRVTRRAFTLVEMLVTLALLSLIVLALMTVFNSTQNAFRASLTETDILESGRTLAYAKDLFAARGARRVLTCVLLEKPGKRAISLDPDFVGFICPDLFVVGYGMDVAHAFRQLPFVGVVEKKS